ncbi:PIG-L family deacetylase [candidate division KSB1 bacterium]|nr:PIG-L family deacetylase [candidate division KSB1 bacterium]
MKNIERVLVLSPHADDGELGCGGTLSRLLEEGKKIYYMAFSICEESVPEGFPKNALEIEVKKATKHLGISPKNLILKNYPVRKFNYSRQEILESLIKIRKEISPDLIFMPFSRSLHQDHKTIFNEGIRAFKHRSCLGYDLPWDNTEFSTTSFFKLEEKHIQKKWESLDFYETQKWRTYCDINFIFGLARVRGAQIAEIYAEAFEMIRIIF